MRLTKNVLQQLLDQNEGFERSTYFRDRNLTDNRHYSISDGELHIRSTGKTSWADSRFDQESIADEDQTRRFLKKYQAELNTDGLE